MDLIAGIDGGGTRTRVVCQTPEGEILAEKEFGAFNLNGTGEAQFTALLAQVTAFLHEVGRCRALVIGAAGVSNPKLGQLTADAMERAGIANWRLVGDHEIALFGALEGRPGCLLIAGTGSICFGRNRAGESACAGGWGHLIGDEGSGYALGRDALSTLAAHRDGLDTGAVLARLVERELGLDSREAIVRYVYGGDKGQIAAAAPLVEWAAAQGDMAANQILEKNAVALAGLVSLVGRRLDLEQGETALCGGLLEHDTGLRRMLISHLRAREPGLRCVAPRRSAVQGAAAMARQLL